MFLFYITDDDDNTMHLKSIKRLYHLGDFCMGLFFVLCQNVQIRLLVSLIELQASVSFISVLLHYVSLKLSV